jgi:hypothetical protein
MKVLPSIVLLASFIAPSVVLAQSAGCDTKRQSIETEIAYAQSTTTPHASGDCRQPWRK